GRIEAAIERPIDVVVTNVRWPGSKVLGRYALEHKEPLAPGQLPAHCEVVCGEFWAGEIARHQRLRLAYAVWTVLRARWLGSSDWRPAAGSTPPRAVVVSFEPGPSPTTTDAARRPCATHAAWPRAR